MEANRVRALVTSARARLAPLPPNARLRRIATDEWFDGLSEAWPPERPSEYLPPLLLFLHRRSTEDLAVFEDDLEQVRETSPEERRVGNFMRAGREADHQSVRQWYAGLAELAVQSSLLARQPAGRVRIEPGLPNGKVTDAAVRIGDRWVWVEVTALTMSDITHAGYDPSPGIHVGYRDPYKDARRMYRKAFDKIVGTGRAPRGQLHPNEPAVLLISMGDISADFELAMMMSLTQMLQPDQRERRSAASFENWLEHDYPEDPASAESQLRHLSALGIITYNLNTLDLQANCAPDDAHRLTVEALASISAALQIDRPWTGEPAHF